jgi:hypothetical protein|tara:strand:+ start:1003 stop:2040 length:1038 start_codon:yes stop_codon:yes gene_type:complete
MSNKQLKKTMEDLNFNIFDLIRYIDPSKTGKYMKFLVKEFRKKHNKEGYTNYTPILSDQNYLDKIRKKSKNELEDRVVEYIMDVLSYTNITNLQVFDELIRTNKIKETDIQKYNSFEDIEKVIVDYEENNHEDNIHEYEEIYRDDRWYIVKPLSYYTAKVYGTATKWCTSSRDTPKQFYEYSKDGILLYIMDRATNNKWAVHWAIYEGGKEEMSWWDAKDRRVDSIQVDIPFGIMNVIKNYLHKEEYPNLKYFSKESLINLKKVLKLEKKNVDSQNFEEILRETHGENFNMAVGGIDNWEQSETPIPSDWLPTIPNPEFDVDEHIKKTLEYSYVLKSINKGGIPQ